MSYKKLLESNLEKAEIVLAVKGEIVDKLQRQAELTSNMKIDVLGPLLDRIKAEHGLDAAADFQNNISGLLDQLVDTMMHVKNEISTETLKLTGDIASTPDITDIDVDIEEPVDSFDIAGNAGLDDVEVDVEADDLTEPSPVEREMKENKQFTQVEIVLESAVTGKVGVKRFTKLEDATTYLTENSKKIKKIISINKA